MQYYNSLATGDIPADAGFTTNFNPEILQSIVSDVFAKNLKFDTDVEAVDFIRTLTNETIAFLRSRNLAVTRENVEANADSILMEVSEKAENNTLTDVSDTPSIASGDCETITEIEEIEVPCDCQDKAKTASSANKSTNPQSTASEWTGDRIRTKAKTDLLLILIIGVFIGLLLYFRNLATLLIGIVGIYLINRKLTEKERNDNV